MRSMVSMLVLLSVSHAQGRLVGSGDTRRYINEKYGFSLSLPRGWSVYLKNDTPLYFHIPPSRVDEFNRGQGKIPKGGAMISVVVEDRYKHSRFGPTLSDWAQNDARIQCECEPPIRNFEMPPASGASEAILTAYDTKAYAIGEKPAHDVCTYWRFGGKRFSACLEYPAGDSRGPEDEKVLPI